jgi:hypothetical protein
MAAIYSIALFLCLVSVVTGEAILRACGYPPRTHLAPAVGLAGVIVLASAVFWLPGHGLTAGVVIGLAGLLAGARLLREQAVPAPAGPLVALAALAAVSIPFLVNRHAGIFGMSIDDDFAAHFIWASSLHSALPGAAVYPDYPLGPHELVDAIASVFGTSVEAPFTALVLSLPALVALTAQAALGRMTLIARVLGGVVVGLPYLVATHLGEGSFKELTMSLMLIGLALTLRQLQREGDWSPRRGLVPGLMLASALLVYGRSGAVWPITACGVWVVAASVQRRVIPSRSTLRVASIFLLALVGCALLGALSELVRIVQFSGGVPGGNVPSDPSPFEVLGVWFSGDFRLAPSDVFEAGLLAGAALAVAVYALAWWVRRGDLAVPATAVASLLVYVVVRGRTGPYLTSKALVIASAPTMLTLVVPMVAAWRFRATMTTRRAATALLGAGFLAVALWSTGFALRYVRVGSDEHIAELGRFRSLTNGQPTLDLTEDDFAGWALRGADLSSPTPYGSAPVVPFQMRKPLPANGTIDVDAITPVSLDGFRYLVTSSSKYASQMPSNWSLVAHTRYFELWRRSGGTRAREVLNEGPAPGALLDCKTPDGRRLRRTSGVAGVWEQPPVGPAAAWSLNGVALAPTAAGFVGAPTGGVLTQVIDLPAGRWELSLAYQSPAHLYLSAADLHAVIPSSLNLLGPYWRLGELTSTGGSVLVTLRLQQMRFDAATQGAAVGGLVAVPVPRKLRVVPLARACGRYVDWYQAGVPGGARVG